ncbi:adenosylmethionine--8-amino-7-oxononanoate transaminase [Sphingobacterium sp. DK4209]|uniref:Adenosylmethionine-8-amino-7-oxononanoate aminotransferase n=1 Tax=Sphingobacterium zhuxiongii TaxID=2662364 RepID=A0A5Q0QC94_9SPHI|nr:MULTISPECIES: adenosylmethionine--8-amino-7-oxononanoate transaminase [unclassified Sphingobacterium]MVZ66637.1 adenosylmethionine--8-amino-7-oxononanoate transaminase [Sphingobacterium sp. DK4209]QGA26819.1 adenosylmethionine--8-amino-7-oxononanoate transaminase [Sphingobacterium sp. dk4302]
MFNELIARDRQVNWHPYSQMKTTTHIPILSGKGSYLFDAEGNRYIDAVSSWWVTLHGHAHPYIADKVYEQLQCLEQVIFAGFTHQPAITLSERLLELLPANQTKVFYSDNGSTAVEVALKMCIQFAHQSGKKKNKILAFKDGYHGDTFGAMSVSERGVWTAPFQDLLFEVIFIDTPNSSNLEELYTLIDQHASELACFIYEPLVQGAGGMLMHTVDALSQLMRHCRNRGVILIQDEVFVGFGRTGTLFAADQLSEQPDVMCFSKGLTGGTMPLGVTTCREEIYQAFYADEKMKAFFHGHSFTASPIACAASLASLDLLLQVETLEAIQRIVGQHTAFAEKVRTVPIIEEVRQCGTILAMDWRVGGTSYFNNMQEQLYKKFLAERILMRPLGNTVYIVPPYCISEEDLNDVYDAILKIAEQ